MKDTLCRYKMLVENCKEKSLKAQDITLFIVEWLNYNQVIKSFEDDETYEHNNVILDIYRDLWKCCCNEDNSFEQWNLEYSEVLELINNGEKYLDGVPLEIKFKDIPILLNPWDKYKILHKFQIINEDNPFNYKDHINNIDNNFLSPMNIVVCEGGNHSQLAAYIRNEGKTIINRCLNYNKLYDYVKFDGENFINIEDMKPIKLYYEKNILFYSGVIFEMGRYSL